MALVDQFKEKIGLYPPEYKLIKKILVDAFANTHEEVWNSLHLELLALELYALACNSGEKPSQISSALTEALRQSQESWGHVYQQLLNISENEDADNIRRACSEGGLFRGLALPSEYRQVEKLGNTLLERMTRISDGLENAPPEKVAADAIRRAVHSLGAKLETMAVTEAGFVDLRDRLVPKLKAMEKPAASGRGGSILVKSLAVVALVVVLGAAAFLGLHDSRSADELFEAARVEYKAANYDKSVALAQSALKAYKAEAAEAKQIHKIRNFLAGAHYKAGEVALAIEQMEILCRANPENQEYRKTLAQLRAEAR